MKHNTNKPEEHPAHPKALVEHIGSKPFIADIVEEGSSGLTLRTGPNDSPATEWFAFECQHGTCRVL